MGDSIRTLIVLVLLSGLLVPAQAQSVSGESEPEADVMQSARTTVGSIAQDTSAVLHLSEEDAVRRARDGSFPVRRAASETERMRAQKRQTLGVFLPQLTASEEATRTTDPVNAFGFKLKQERFAQSDFQIDQLNDPDRIDNFSTKLEAEQPLFNLDGLFRRRAASDAVRAASLSEQRTEEVISFETRKGYYGLVLAEQRVGVIDSALAAARSNEQKAQDLFEQGMINRADVLAAQVRVSELESERARARADRRTAADRLRVLLGLEEDVDIEPTDSLTKTTAQVAQIDVGRINQTRSDMRALRYRADAAKEQTRGAWTEFVPTLNARGTYAWNDDTAFGTRGSGYTVGVALTWNLFSGFQNIGRAQENEARLQEAQIQVEEQALKNQVDIAEARRDLRTTRQEIAQAETAVAQARESLRIRSDRYTEGLAQTTDLLQAEATLAERRLAYLKALYDHNIAIYRLEMLTERPLASE